MVVTEFIQLKQTQNVLCGTFALLKMQTKVTKLNRSSYNSWY